MKKIILQIFDLLGLRIMKKRSYLELLNALKETNQKQTNNDISMQGGIDRAFERGIRPSTIIDVGAAQGLWSINAMKLWSKSDFVLFEPLEERRVMLDKLAVKYNNFHVIHKGAGDNNKMIDFFVTDDLDGSGVADNGTNSRKTTIEITKLDEEIILLNLKPPYLLKLDTHGYEVPIIGGAAEVLKKTILIIIECYGYQIAPNSLYFWEMCNLMGQKGFRLVDIVDISYRPKDKTFWQCDAFFVPDNSEHFKYNSYHY